MTGPTPPSIGTYSWGTAMVQARHLAYRWQVRYRVTRIEHLGERLWLVSPA